MLKSGGEKKSGIGGMESMDRMAGLSSDFVHTAKGEL